MQMLITPMTDDIPFPEQYGMTAPTQWQIPAACWLPTWNISGKWNIGNEAFMKDFVWLDALALRAGVGLTASMPPLSNATPIFINSNTTRPSTDIESGIVNLTH